MDGHLARVVTAANHPGLEGQLVGAIATQPLFDFESVWRAYKLQRA
jgi:hypothetical protein